MIPPPALDLVFGLSFLLNTALAAGLAVFFRHRAVLEKSTEKTAKRWYSVLCPAAGVFSALLFFPTAVTLFKLPLGHGEILFSVVFFNGLLSLVLIVLGRILIGWKPIRW